MLTIGSFFSGIGGLDLGIESGLASAGWQSQTIWQIEQDEYCRAVLARHWPQAQRYTDVTTIDPSSLAAVDICIGGFPCQDISTSGRGEGISGHRSGRFFAMAEIVRVLRPPIWILENSPEINLRGLDALLGTLAEIGFDAKWGCLRASSVGAPHKRDRWFCVAWMANTDKGIIQERRNAGGMGRIEQPISENRGRSPAIESRMGRNVDGASGRLVGHRWPAPPGAQYKFEPPRTRRARQPQDRQRLAAIANACVPQQAEVIGRWVGQSLIIPHPRG